MNAYKFSISDKGAGSWKQQTKHAKITKYWKLQKLRWGAIGDSDGIGGPARDSIEHAANINYPSSTMFLPYNWWIVCAG